MDKTLRELVEEVKRTTKKPSRARKKPRTAKKRSAKVMARECGSEHNSPKSDSTVVATPSKPVTLADTKEERWRLFATTYIFGRREDNIPPFNGARSYLYVYA